MVLIQSPLKLILFGEYGVLSGGPAIAIAINKKGFLASNLDEKLTVVDKTGEEYDFTAAFPEYKNNKIILEAEIGSCLGTSAVISLFLSYIKYQEKSEKMLKNAIEIENIFHGKSSGVDVWTSYMGGVIKYQFGLAEPLDVNFSKYKIMIWYSGIKKSTKTSVIKSNPEVYPEIAKVAEEALDMFKNSFSLKKLYRLIRKAQDLLDILDICPDIMKEKINELRALGIESKTTGSGNGGYLITIVDKIVDLKGWEEVNIDYNGFSVN